MCETVNHNLLFLINALMRLALTRQPAVVPLPPDTVLTIPLVPSFSHTSNLCRAVGNACRSVSKSPEAIAPAGRFSLNVRPPSPVAVHARRNSSYALPYRCNMFATTDRCKWRDCSYVCSPPRQTRRLTSLSAIGVTAYRRPRALGHVHALVLPASSATRAAGVGGASGGGGLRSGCVST